MYLHSGEMGEGGRKVVQVASWRYRRTWRITSTTYRDYYLI
jgi:hypothetical protein